MAKTIDIFSYNGEADILRLRLNILKVHVDEFIICEGDETTAGTPKPRYFEHWKRDNAALYYELKKAHKIKCHIFAPYEDPIMKTFSYGYLPIDPAQHWWHREFIQKESMRYAMTHLHDDDRVFIGDVDEIWNPEITYPEGRAELQQTVYTYWLNNKSSEHWTGTSLMTYKDIKGDTLDNLRAYDERRKFMWAPVIQNAGWHFTNIGGAEFIKRKVQSYAHQEFNTPVFLAQIDERIEHNEDYLGRPFKLGIDIGEWPRYLKENYDQYKHLIKEPW